MTNRQIIDLVREATAKGLGLADGDVSLFTNELGGKRREFVILDDEHLTIARQLSFGAHPPAHIVTNLIASVIKEAERRGYRRAQRDINTAADKFFGTFARGLNETPETLKHL